MDVTTLAKLEAALQELSLNINRHSEVSKELALASARLKESVIRHRDSLLQMSVATKKALTMLRGKNC